jgi:ABC-2 type transport system ATP-binding protein
VGDTVSAIQACGLTRRHGTVTAVDRVSFAVSHREIFGFLGPNGAGKTTTVRLLTGYLAPSEGTATLDGHDVVTDPLAARQRLGVVPESANVYVDLTVWQNVMLMAELYRMPRARRTHHGAALLELFGLADRKTDKGGTLSKGLRQRLMLCMALVGDPTIVFLDEPTSGLDVASARLIRETIARLNRERGLTVFLTTHNMEEANQLCHRVAIIHRGRIAAVDTPAALRATIEARRFVEATFAKPPVEVPALPAVRAVVEPFAGGCGVRIFAPEPGHAAQELAAWATARGLRLETICTQGPSLEDVFLSLTAGAPVPAEAPARAPEP